MLGYGRGHGVIMDNSYRIVRSVEPAGSVTGADEHEFKLLNGGKSALLTVYHVRAWDLSEYGIAEQMGYITDSIFQEIDVETGDLIFEWRSSEHVGLNESVVGPKTTEISGDGLTKKTPWDYFHINSVDKNADGDYLISARHTSAIYKICGEDGSVLWRLNGEQSDFKLESGLTFSHQHDARWLPSAKAGRTRISLFDNASNGFARTRDHSRGLIVELNHDTMEAKEIMQYGAPDPHGGLESKSQGNTQVLPNGNVFQGWGPQAFLSEHQADGTPVMYSWIALTGTMIYRCMKFNWTATPVTSPTVWSYSNGGEGTVVYASWNGATEVSKWNFYSSQTKQGPWKQIATEAKTGFETHLQHDAFSPFVYAEAVDSKGKVLKKSSVEKTLVPSSALLSTCQDCKFGLDKPLTPDEKTQLAKIKAAKESAEAERIAELVRHEQSRKRALWGLCGFSIFATAFLFSRKGAQQKLLALVRFSRIGASEARERSVGKINDWRGRYQRLNGQQDF